MAACLFGLVVGFGTHAVWVGTALLRTRQAGEWTLEPVDAAEQAALPPELLELGVKLLGEKELASVLRNSVSLTGSMQGIPTKLFFSKSDGQGTVDLRAQVTAYVATHHHLLLLPPRSSLGHAISHLRGTSSGVVPNQVRLKCNAGARN